MIPRMDQTSLKQLLWTLKDIIFKSDLSDQLYSFYYYFYSDGSNSGLATSTTKQSNAFLDDINNRDLDVEVAPAKKLLVTFYDYVRDDSN